MRNILIILGLLFISSCTYNNSNSKQYERDVEEVTLVPLFKEGDIIYLKPDSTMCVVLDEPDVYNNYINYRITYNNNCGERVYYSVRDCEIFGK